MAPTKVAIGKSKKKQKEVATCSFGKFISDKSAEKYETLQLQHRNIILERKMEVSAEELDEMAKQIVDRKWQTLISYPEVAYTELVREFYANVYYPNKDQKAVSWIRGIEVPFNLEVINRLLRIEPIQGSYWTDDDIDYDEILKLICIEGTSWNLNAKGEPINVKYSTLKPLSKVWASFLVFNIFPNSNPSDVKLDQAQSIYLIMTGRRVNVGEIIEKEILTIANSKSLALAYPFLITLLCEDAGVKLDGFIRMKKPNVIDLTYAINFCGIGGDTTSRARKRQKVRAPKRKKVSKYTEGESSGALTRTNQLLENIITNSRKTHNFCAVVHAHVLNVEDKLDLLLKAQRVSFPPRPEVSFEVMQRIVGWRSLPNNDDAEEDREDEEGSEEDSEDDQSCKD